ncbi:uncharacterized protein LOC121430257 [Lytechinus variegatus]|uniref:uncharacterized protein LOC121430257 n=1 Tax=Lytechinus variegatus TaxID=7654 RepID=UPI001BB25DF0|nr:uncharacterized protein LOC121430257 [Lytechinus variegatus]
MDQGYGDYGGQPRNGNYTSVHLAEFLGSRKMGRHEPTAEEVMVTIKGIAGDYQVNGRSPRAYNIIVTPTEVIVEQKKIKVIFDQSPPDSLFISLFTPPPPSYLDAVGHDERIQIKYINFCIHDRSMNHIFAFVAWSESQRNFILHVFFCPISTHAANLKAAFAMGFQAAFKEWKNDARPPRRHTSRDAYSEYGPPAKLTVGALDHHRRSYEAPAVLEREQYRPARVTSRQRPRNRSALGPRPNQLIEVYGDPRQAGYDYDFEVEDDFIGDFPPPPRPAVEKEVMYTRETLAPPGGDVYERRNGIRGPGAAYDDDVYASRRVGYGDRGGRRSRRYVDSGYARDDMIY